MRTMKTEEIENFDKTIKFESGHFAIVDADVIKALKDKIPLDEKAIFVSTKQSKDGASLFRVVAEYDDASLRKLVVEPSAVPEASDTEQEQVEESFEGRSIETRQGSGVQKQGNGGDVAQRKLSQKRRVADSTRPKSGERSERNKRYSAKGDQKPKLTKGPSSVEQRVKQAVSHQGAELANFGQPKVRKEEKEFLDLLQRAKNGSLSEEYLNSLENLREIRALLADVRDNARVKGRAFDLVYDIVHQLDEHWHKSACVWVEDIIRKGYLDV